MFERHIKSSKLVIMLLKLVNSLCAKDKKRKENVPSGVHLFGKELFILFAASAFRKLSSIYVFSYFPFGFEGRMWNLIVSVPDHCLSFYFSV